MKPENIFVTIEAQRRGRPEAPRLRHREGRRQRRPEQPDPHRHDLRHAVLHGARAGARKSRRRAHRHLRDGRDHVRVLRRLAAVPGRVVHGHSHAAHHDASPSRSRSARRRRDARCRWASPRSSRAACRRIRRSATATMDELVNALIQVYRGDRRPRHEHVHGGVPRSAAPQHQVQPTPPPMTAGLGRARWRPYDRGRRTAPAARARRGHDAASRRDDAGRLGIAARRRQSGLYDPSGSSSSPCRRRAASGSSSRSSRCSRPAAASPRSCCW